MKINTNSNIYTIVYATVLIVVVAAILAITATSLKDRQQKNIDIETMSQILSAVNIDITPPKGTDKAEHIERLYKKYIPDSYVVNHNGDKIEGEAFSINLKEQYDIIRQLKSDNDPDLEKLRLPVFIHTTDNGDKVEILAIFGAGLWGPIWGYIAVESDFATIYGATFAHTGETPGLGAEIGAPEFALQFTGKQIFDRTKFTSIKIKKGGATPGVLNEVDAVTGGTITSNALEKAINMWLYRYLPYIEKSNHEKQ